MSTAIAEHPNRVYYADRIVIEHIDGSVDDRNLNGWMEFNDLVASCKSRWGQEYHLAFSLSGGEFRCTILGRRV